MPASSVPIHPEVSDSDVFGHTVDDRQDMGRARPGYLARMLKMPLLSILAALALAAALPACGDDEPASDGATQEQTTTGGSVEEPSSEDVQAAVDACKQSVENAPQLSADAKTEIAGICEEGDTSDPEQIKDNAGKVCERIVEETVPEGPGRDQALETCRAATE